MIFSFFAFSQYVVFCISKSIHELIERYGLILVFHEGLFVFFTFPICIFVFRNDTDKDKDKDMIERYGRGWCLILVFHDGRDDCRAFHKDLSH